MKLNILLAWCCIVVLSDSAANAQAPPFEWVRSAGGTNVGPSYNNDNVTSLAMDSSGNIFIAGIFESASMALGSVHLDNPRYDQSIKEGNPCLFIAKYDPSGNCTWAKVFGVAINQLYSECPVIAADQTGNVYIAGVYGNSLDGSAIFGAVTIKGTGMFLVKLDPDGTPLWGKSDDGISTGNGYVDGATCIATDAQGNVYEGAEFFAPKVTFGATTLKDTDTLGISSDIVLVKYDPSGNVVWAKSAGGSASDAPTSISIDHAGNLYLAGISYSSSIAFGSITLSPPAGYLNTGDFIAKYSSAGDCLWAKRSALGATVTSVASDETGVYMTGESSSPEIFVSKYSPSGDLLWFATPKGTANSYGDVSKSIAVGPSGTVDITGYFLSSTLAFGSTTLTVSGSPVTGSIFAAQYDAAGNALWAKSAAATGFSNDYSFATTTDRHGAVYIAGGFTSRSILFDQVPIASADPTSPAAPENLFLAKIAAPATNTVANPITPAYFNLACSPNPTTDRVSLLYSSEREGSAILTITDILDRVILSYEFNAHIGTNEETINLASIPEGSYYFLLRCDSHASKTKVIVKH